jgi:para-aminobenzoate synthetase / 4-amino-4-deoxychorismate lyase
VQQHGYWAAGFLSYEAAPAFDPAFRTPPPGPAPLLWFGLFPPPRIVDRPETIARRAEGPDLLRLGSWQSSVDWPTYRGAINQIKQAIAAGETYQVNYTLRLRATFDGRPWPLFLDLAHAQKGRLAAYVETEWLAICSASPELFFSLNGRRLVSRPMKGTVGRGRTLAEDEERAAWLKASDKNRAENVMIVDMIRNDMGRVARTGSVTVPALFDLERYPTVWQMTSTVQAETATPLSEIMAALFPCASITGAPKVRTMSIIARLEAEPRGVYTGCIGYMAPDRQARFNVAIRTVVVDKNRGTAEYGVGGGIVWDSDAESEYEECQVKTRILTATSRQTPLTGRSDFQLLESLLWTPDEGYFLLERHLQRLADSATYFDFSCDGRQVADTLTEFAAGLPPVNHKVRLLMDVQGTLSLSAEPARPLPVPVRLGLALEPVSVQDVALFHKTTERTVYERARAGRPDCDDVLLWNQAGQVTESTIANVVVRLDGELLTPPVFCGLLNGTFRAQLLAEGQLKEGIIRLEDLVRVEDIFLINSVRRWRPAELVPPAAQ